MEERTCAWCGASIEHKRANALYCSKSHRSAAAAQRYYEREFGSSSAYWKHYNKTPTRVASITTWAEENRETILANARAAQAEYRVKNPDVAATWWAANPDKHCRYQRNRRFAKANNPGSVGISDRDWRRLVQRYDGRCAYCGVRPKVLHLDHVIPLKRGGRDAIGNALPACPSCNFSKNASLLVEWRYRRGARSA